MVRWSRYVKKEKAWYDPVIIASISYEGVVGTKTVYSPLDFLHLFPKEENVYGTINEDVMTPTNLIRYVDIKYNRTFSNGVDKNYVIRFEYNPLTKKFTAISEKQV